MSEDPLWISCLCVTESRPAFMPWLAWNYEKQDHERRELIVVDGSRPGGDVPWEPPGAIVVRCPEGTSVARKRNLAVEAARGDVVAWFDDDDWQHPRRLSILAEALAGGADLAGCRESWFVDLRHDRARAFVARRHVIFNSIGVRRGALEGVTFDDRRQRAADTTWMAAVGRRSERAAVTVPEVLAFWLCHDANLSNPARRYHFPHSIGAARDAIGQAAWAETDAELSLLRERLEGA